MSNFNFLKGNIDTIILNSLLLGDKYGFEISRDIKDKTDNKYEIKQATLYGYLKRLEDNGLIRSYWGEESRGGRRKYFTLTDLGRNTCKEFNAEWSYRKNVLETLVVDGDEELSQQSSEARDVFLGSKLPKQKKNYTTIYESEKIAEQIKRLNSDVEPLQAFETIRYEANEEVTQTHFIQEEVKPRIKEELPRIPLSDAFNDEKSKKDKRALKTFDVPGASDHHSEYKQPTTILKERYPNEDIIGNNYTIEKNKANQIGLNLKRMDEETELQKRYKNVVGELIGNHIHNSDDYEQIKASAGKRQSENQKSAYESNIVELAEELSKEGVKIRFFNSATSNYRAVPMLLKNKINCVVAWVVTLIFSIAMLSVYLFGNNVSLAVPLFAAILFLLFPLVFTIIYITKPYIQIKPKNNFTYSFVTKTVIFVVGVLFVLSLDLIVLKLTFSDTAKALTQFFVPVFALFMLPLSALVHKLFLNLRAFYN